MLQHLQNLTLSNPQKPRACSGPSIDGHANTARSKDNSALALLPRLLDRGSKGDDKRLAMPTVGSSEGSIAAAIVHVIDDDQSLRDALDSLFRSVGLHVRLYGSVHEFLDSKTQATSGCIVLDVRLPGTSGLDFQQQLADLNIKLPVILMTGHGDIPMSVRAMKSGAIDFLPKPFRDQDMLDAVAAALRDDDNRRQAEAREEELRERFNSLSPREREVMELVTAGRLNKQVAGDLGLSEITVKIHRGSAMRKMRARTLPDLVRMSEALKMRR